MLVSERCDVDLFARLQHGGQLFDKVGKLTVGHGAFQFVAASRTH
jgi:hypothetical protein